MFYNLEMHALELTHQNKNALSANTNISFHESISSLIGYITDILSSLMIIDNFNILIDKEGKPLGLPSCTLTFHMPLFFLFFGLKLLPQGQFAFHIPASLMGPIQNRLGVFSVLAEQGEMLSAAIPLGFE